LALISIYCMRNATAAKQFHTTRRHDSLPARYTLKKKAGKIIY